QRRPAAMPSMMGLVMIPFSVLFQSPFLGASLAGEVRERTTTAMMLYRGTLPMIISGTSPASPRSEERRVGKECRLRRAAEGRRTKRRVEGSAGRRAQSHGGRIEPTDEAL